MNSGFFKKNLIKVIVVGIIISLLAPFYSGGSDHNLGRSRSESIMEKLGGSYFDAVVWILVVYVSFCVIGHVGFSVQDAYRIKRFEKLKKEIEKG